MAFLTAILSDIVQDLVLNANRWPIRVEVSSVVVSYMLVTVMGYLLQDTQSTCTTGGSAIYDKGAVSLGSLWTTTQPIEAKVAKHSKDFPYPSTSKWLWLTPLKGRVGLPSWHFPRGAVVENLPADAGNTGSSPGPGRSHMPQSN